jgi:CTP synthase
LAAQLYKAEFVDERHRHRYEVDPDIVPQLEASTPLRFSGRDETRRRMEICELAPAAGHPFFLAVQFHPEVSFRVTIIIIIA